MKILLFLNGPEGCQTGIEDGFNYILKENKIDSLKWFYYTDFAGKNTELAAKNKMIELALDLQPNLIVFFHLGSFRVDNNFLDACKTLKSKPTLVYDEGDMYGTWAKPIKSHLETMIREVDVVSIRGLGEFYEQVKKINKNIIYTPHHNDIARFDDNINIERCFDLLLIGNRVKPRFLSALRRLPGAKGRETFVKRIGDEFPEQFKLFGNGWSGYRGDQGPVDFYKQNKMYQQSLITVAYEHYPNIPYYFSNRLPMALMNGSIYVCHYHEGYEKMFPNCDFIFFFKTNEEAIDIINYLLSLSKAELLLRSKHAKEFALRQYHPNVIWMNFYNNILKNVNFKFSK
jgi:hypothetical protein